MNFLYNEKEYIPFHPSKSMDWKDKLHRGLDKKSILCVGLDTDMDRLRSDFESQIDVNRMVVDATKDVAAAYKPNLAFYEKEGADGIRSLKDTIIYIREKAPDALIILDGKKGDIGNTSASYAKAAYEEMDVDSVTLNGYMGRDVVEPFIEYSGRLNFVLCRTSNSSADPIQNLDVGGMPFYLIMAEMIREWNGSGNLGLVVGATYPNELSRIRKSIGFDMPILIPGIGSQGGNLEAVLENGTDQKGGGILINVSRGIMFAYQREEFKGMELGEAAFKASYHYGERIRRCLEDLGRW